jgi:lipopolysaccharide biosynthesis glycosyltransferase
MINRETIHLAAAFDENYLTPFYVLLTSIFTNNVENSLHFHVIATGVSPERKQQLINFVKSNNAQIEFYSLEGKMPTKFVGASSDPRYTLAVYYRLFFSVLVSDKIRKLLYLDTDIVVIGDLYNLYNENFSEPFAAVADTESAIRTDLGITREGDYFNSGVMLMNLAVWRSKQISEKAIGFIMQFPEKCLFVDQDALNAVVLGDWKRLDPRYNLMNLSVPNLTRYQYNRYLQDKVVIHFNHLKPWDRFCKMRLKFLYYQYFKMSPERQKRMYKKFDLTARNLVKLGAYELRNLYFDYFAFQNLFRQTN